MPGRLLRLRLDLSEARAFAIGHFLDDRVAESCLFSADEWPMLIVGFTPIHPGEQADADEMVVFGGQPNDCRRTKTYPLIERIHNFHEAQHRIPPSLSGEPKVSGPR